VWSSAASNLAERRPVYTLLADTRGVLWVGSDIGLFVLRPGSSRDTAGPRELAGGRIFRADRCPRDQGGAPRLPQRAWEVCRVVLPAGSPHPNVRALLETRNGVIVGLESGQILEVNDGAIRTLHSDADRPGISSLAEDRSGNLWASHLTRGLSRIARRGLVTYDLEAELGGVRVRTILGERDGALMLATGRLSIYRLQRDSVTRVRIGFPARVLLPQWASELLDRTGDFWIGTGQGLFRFAPSVESDRAPAARLSAIYTTREGLATDAPGELFEDSRGDVWIGTSPGSSDHVITRWERSSGRITRVPSRGTLRGHVTSFAEDAAGQVWAAFRDGGFARTSAGLFDLVPGTEDLVSRRLYFDRTGRLWATGLTGALRYDDPSAARPQATRYTTRDGLSSDRVNCFAEDSLGHLYIGTMAGIDRLHVASGRIRHYGAGGGVPTGEIFDAFVASNGSLWFTTGVGLVSLAPDATASSVPPVVRIADVTIAGTPQPLPELGADAAGEFRLPVAQSRVAISFFGLSPDLVEPIRYQYRLEGLDPDWSAPTREQSITYARLPVGAHRFSVRALTASGQASATEAVVSFRVLPPVWQRWWFVSIALGLIGATIYAAHRYRLSHAIRLERVRHRIATDLHDDIGASLTQIAMLSDAGRSQLEARDVDAAAHRLSVIATTSRELVDTMSDIVWAVNPNRDSVDDLVHRMRRFATETLESADVVLQFVAPASGAALRLGPNIRRELLLVVKESVANIVRHGRSTSAEIELSIERHRLRLRISDNGCGFDTAAASGGNGLRNMRRRVESLGGHFTVQSAPGRGTAIILEILIS
jgi:signal transduction histidine kinase